MCTVSTFPAHMYLVRTIEDRYDDRCHGVLLSWQRGEITELQARQDIAVVLEHSGIYRAVAREGAREGLRMNWQLAEDIEHDMRDLVYGKITPCGPTAFFDLTVALNSSVMGWARQLLRSSKKSVVRDITNRTVSKETLVDPIPPPNVIDPQLPPTYRFFHSVPSAKSEMTEDDSLRSMQDAADWLNKRARFQRGNARISNQAAALRSAYRLPATVRPILEERRRLQSVLEADPEAALRSVKAMCAIISREHAPEPCDKGLLALWDDYSFDNLDTLAHLSERVAGALAAAAVADRPRMPKPVIRTFRATVRALGSGLEWRSLSEELCEVFNALEFEAFSPFDTTGASFHEHRIAGRKLSILKSDDVFARVMAHEDHRLGRDFDEVYAQLDRLVRELSDVEVVFDQSSLLDGQDLKASA